MVGRATGMSWLALFERVHLEPSFSPRHPWTVRRDSTSGPSRSAVVSRTPGGRVRHGQFGAAADQAAQSPEHAAPGSDPRSPSYAAGHPRALGGTVEIVDVVLHHEVVHVL